MATAPRDAPFVGREAELGELITRTAAAAEGRGGLLLLSGPAGIGKTRTVEELALRAGRSVWGRCVDDPGAPPLWPWRQVLRRLPDTRAAVSEALSTVDLLRGHSGDAEAARFGLVAATTDALLAAAEPDGLVVVLEDLHWADETSLRLLRHLAGELRGSRLLVVGTHRDPPGPSAPPAWPRALPDLLRWPTTGALRLPALTEDDVRRWLGDASGGPDDVRDAHRRSGGNPLFLRALAWAPADSGLELRSIVRAALGALPPATADLLDAAAVLGEDVDVEVLAALAGAPPEQVLGELDAAVAAGVLTAVPDAPGRRRFVHAVVRDSVYAGLAPSTREELHRRAAEAIEARAPADGALAGVVAGHWLRAAAGPGTLSRAGAAARRAATAATRLLAFEDAARFLAAATELAARTGAPPEERAELLVELATAEFRAGRFAESLQHAAAAADLLPGGARADLLAAAALVVHDVAVPEFAPTLHRLVERALAAVDGQPVLRARLLAQYASVLADVGRSAASASWSAEAVALAESTGDPEAVVDAVRARMKTSGHALEVDERMRLGSLAIGTAAVTGQPLAELWGAKWRIDAALEAGDLPVVEEELARVGELAARTRLPLVRWHDLRLRASVLALVGRFAEAVALNEQARQVGAAELAADLSAAGLSSAFEQQHALVTGERLAPDPEVLAMLDRAGATPVVVVSRALVALLAGDVDDAAARYAGLRDRLADPDFVAAPGVAINVLPLVEAFGDTEAAEALLGTVRAMRGAAGGAGVYGAGSPAALAGRLAVVLGRRDEAAARFAEALRTDTATGARPAAVHDRIGLAGVLLDGGSAADLARAAELARTALGEARHLGMPGPQRQAAALLDRAAAATRAADPLTAREREVAGLVARACTNRQIAAQLFLSERTVESHVRNILAKLGLANRTEIATAVVGAHGGRPARDRR